MAPCRSSSDWSPSNQSYSVDGESQRLFLTTCVRSQMMFIKRKSRIIFPRAVLSDSNAKRVAPRFEHISAARESLTSPRVLLPQQHCQSRALHHPQLLDDVSTTRSASPSLDSSRGSSCGFATNARAIRQNLLPSLMCVLPGKRARRIPAASPFCACYSCCPALLLIRLLSRLSRWRS
jgi:hypothetical protein